ncbi:hypothetical protein A8M77_04555 [Variovorax sp. JS1663]|nr:hypothetical protein A8M77_04555 [Variovorax sp. JS1663]
MLAKGNAAVGEQDFAKAAGFYRQAAEIQPDSLSAHIGLGYARLQLGELPLAIDALKVAVSLDPEHGDGLYMLGKAYAELQRGDEAERTWGKGISVTAQPEEIFLDFCLLLFNSGKIERAQTVIEQGIFKHPQNADLHFFLGNVLAEKGLYSESIPAYEQALSLGLGSPHLLSNLGNSLRQVGHIDRSLEMAKRAVELAPDVPQFLSNYLLSTQYSPNVSRVEKFEAHLEFSRRFEAPLKQHWRAHENDFDKSRRLRVGYVSGDFRNHSLAYFIEPILRSHDRSGFEIHCYYTYPVQDEVSERIRRLSDRWVPCSTLSDDELADRIRSDAIDILIDLSGHTGHNRLLAFARRPAPIQMTWLGYQATTGLSAIDFRITEESLDPTGSSEAFHSEKLLRLPSSGTFSPAPNSPDVGGQPALEGYPFTFGCLNNPSKIADPVIEAWAEILRTAPASRLMVGHASLALREALLAKFDAHGIGESRIVFQPKVCLRDYLSLHHQIDLALDTFPYNGGTTTFHSVWMGVPVLAVQGDTALSNVGASVMRGLGLDAFCASTVDEYVAKAIRFSGEADALSSVRTSLRQRVEVLTNNLARDVTLALEQGLRQCWADYCDGPSVALPQHRLAGP